MTVLLYLIELIARLPDYLTLLVAPALLLVCTIAFAIVKRQKWLTSCAFFLGALGFVLVCCEGGTSAAFIWLGLYCAFFLVLRGSYALLRKRKPRPSREQKLYEKFHVSLDEEVQTEECKPPKVSCYFEESEQLYDAEESGLRLSHVMELLERLQGLNLSPADRLETDVISRHIEGYRRRKLTSEELSTLNDYLATVLRLTAKYSL